MGYLRITDPEARPVESDTVTCAHCNRVWETRSTDARRANLGGFCRQCMAAVCAPCAGRPCTPFLRKIEQHEAGRRLMEAVGR